MKAKFILAAALIGLATSAMALDLQLKTPRMVEIDIDGVKAANVGATSEAYLTQLEKLKDDCKSNQSELKSSINATKEVQKALKSEQSSIQTTQKQRATDIKTKQAQMKLRKKDNSSINKQIKEVNKNKMLDNATRSTQLNGLQQRLTKNDNDDRADEATIQNINREIEKLGETLSKNQKNQIEAQNHLNELNAQLEQNNQKMKLIDGEIKVVKGNIKTEKAAAKAAAKAAK